MEILAPVNADTLDAALNAGADAVYFGLKKLNARRGARNFTQDDLADVIRKIHSAGAKAHLTLNIDLDARETGLAARTLAFAQECGVDAVIVRDPAVLALRKFFPHLEFHLSTQAGLSTSAGVRMAKKLGCDRAVMARELTREEIAECCRIGGIAVEVFGQGALCFCASGRCLLSSWVGGRSGNRGACASPCRVGWKSAVEGTREEHPLSMKDLCLVERLPELSRIGVASLKIEGRLKSAPWVSQAVSLYRQANDAVDGAVPRLEEAASLGGYTGRALTEGYYVGEFRNLTDNTLGRAKAAPSVLSCHTDSADEAPALQTAVSQDSQGGLCFQFTFGAAKGSTRIPPQRIANPRRAISLGNLLEAIQAQLPASAAAEFLLEENLKGLLLPRRCQDALLQALMDFLRQATREDDGNIHMALPPETATALLLRQPCPENRRSLGTTPNLLRLRLSQAHLLKRFMDKAGIARCRVILAITPKDTTDAFSQALSRLPEEMTSQTILALPAVCYEADLAPLKALVLAAKERGLLVEVNSWDTMALVQETGAAFVTGQGLSVLNPLAVRMLAGLGARWCAVSCEADRRQLEELTAAAEFPLAIPVYGKPALMTTRAVLPEAFAPKPDGAPGIPFHDARKVVLSARNEGTLTTLRPETAYDWRQLRNAKIIAAYWEVDFSGENSPDDILEHPQMPYLFNYDRQLR